MGGLVTLSKPHTNSVRRGLEKRWFTSNTPINKCPSELSSQVSYNQIIMFSASKINSLQKKTLAREHDLPSSKIDALSLLFSSAAH